MDKKLLSIGETARILGISVDTLRRWDKKGILKPFRASSKGYRYYDMEVLELFGKDLFSQAEKWVENSEGLEPDSSLYCQSSDIFQARLVKLQNSLLEIKYLDTSFSLIVAAIGEIGNNSFDHNLGNWRDLPGVFFGYDLNKKYIVLADRGQGVLRTLQRVRPALNTDAEALRVAFTEIVSGRAPESRGNGLKYVKKIVEENPLELTFESGNAKLSIKKGDSILEITEKTPYISGCVARIIF